MNAYSLLYKPQRKDDKPQLTSQIKLQYVAIIASLIAVFGFIPQIVRVYKTKDLKSFSMIWLVGLFISSVLWLIFGIINKIYADIISGGFFSIFYFTFIIIKIRS